MLKRFWLLFAQTVTVGVALALVYQVFHEDLATAPGRREVVTATQTPASGATGVTPAGSFRRAVAKAGPSVVNIYTAKAATNRRDSLYRFFYGDEAQENEVANSLGSGVIVSEQGHILTNNHVVEGADQIAVVLSDGRIAEAKILGADPETDLAVLKIAAPKLRPIAFADPGAVQVGDAVLAVGNPFGVGQTVTQGIVSATGRNKLGINTFENFIQTDAAINPGNSGGALIDIEGSLVGINTAIFSQSGGSQGIGFAIPVSLAKQVMEQIVASGRVVRGWIGVAARDPEPGAGAGRGAVIAGVQRGGPAEKAGIAVGDVVVAVNGKAIADTSALINETAALSPGTRAEVRIVRGGREAVLAIELGQRPVAGKARR